MEYQGDFQATFQGGALRPGADLGLKDGDRVTLSIRNGAPTPETRKRGWDVIDRVRREGLIKLHGMRWTRDNLYDRR